MKKFIKIFVISFLLVALPLSFVLGAFAIFRNAINKPFCYAKKVDYPKHIALTVENVHYAKVKEDCYLFKTSDITNTNFSNVWFIVPRTYFVTIISDVNSMITKVEYQEKIGFVSADSIIKVDFLPVNPVLSNITFDIDDDYGTQLRSSPEIANNVKKVIPAGTNSISYVASILGERPTGGTSNIWYYAIYSPEADPTSVYEGYVYSDKTTNLTAIMDNEENIESPSLEVEPDEEYVLNSTVKTILIVLICVPIVLVFVLLLLSNRKNKNKLEKELDQEFKEEKKKDSVKINAKKVKNNIKKIDDLGGQTLERKPVFYTNFLKNNDAEVVSANLKPEFPTYEVIDDDDLL